MDEIDALALRMEELTTRFCRTERKRRGTTGVWPAVPVSTADTADSIDDRAENVVDRLDSATRAFLSHFRAVD